MRREVIFVVLGLILGAAPIAIGQGDGEEELRERLRALETVLHKVMHRAQPIVGAPAVSERGFQLAVLPMADLTAGLTDFIPPDHRLGGHKDSEIPLFGGLSEEAPQPYGTIEEIIELVRTSVWPVEWESGGTITGQGKQIVVYHKPAMVRGVRTFLDKDLRTRVHRSVIVQAEILEVSAATFRALRKHKGSTLPSAKRFGLDESIKSKASRVLFRGRVTGLASQRVLMWHGKQVAVLSDTDVEVADNARCSDPIIDAVQAGGYISVRPKIGGDGKRLQLDVTVGMDELKEPIATRETIRNGTLDMPEIRSIEATASISVPVRAWALVGSALVGKDRVRIVLVRGEIVERGGAK